MSHSQEITKSPRILSRDEVGRIDPDLLGNEYRIDFEVAEVRLSGFYSIDLLESLLRDLRLVQTAVDEGKVQP